MLEPSQPSPPPIRGSAVRRLTRVVIWSTGGILAVIGMTAGPVVAVFGIFAGCLGALAGYGVAVRARHPARIVVSTVVMFAAAGLGALFAVAGLVLAIGPAALPVAGLALGAAFWWRGGGPSAKSPAADRPIGGEDDLRRLSNAQLGREWRRSHTMLVAARDAGELDRVSRLRRLQLDEMERRDPAGFGRWLGSGAWVLGDSAPFLGG
jgi:hypothetical protein